MGVRSVNGQDLTALLTNSASRAPASRQKAAEASERTAPQARTSSRLGEERAEKAAGTARSNPAVQRSGTRLRIDEASKQIIAQIVNQNNEVIKQIPPEDALKIAARFRELTGKLFDQKV